jgi:hypothetical protein
MRAHLGCMPIDERARCLRRDEDETSHGRTKRWRRCLEQRDQQQKRTRKSEMRKILITALGLASLGTLASVQLASAALDVLCGRIASQTMCENAPFPGKNATPPGPGTRRCTKPEQDRIYAQCVSKKAEAVLAAKIAKATAADAKAEADKKKKEKADLTAAARNTVTGSSGPAASFHVQGGSPNHPGTGPASSKPSQPGGSHPLHTQ